MPTVNKKPPARPVEVIEDDASDDDCSSGWRTVHSDDEDDEFEYDESKVGAERRTGESVFEVLGNSGYIVSVLSEGVAQRGTKLDAHERHPRLLHPRRGLLLRCARAFEVSR